MILVVAAIIYAVKWTDEKRWFATDTQRKEPFRWSNFYTLKDTVPFDIICVGSSKTQCGVNAHALSTTLGNVSYLICADGLDAVHTYHALKDVLDDADPKLVFFDSYSLYLANSHNAVEFQSRFNLRNKILGMPDMFAIDQYPGAWSETVRNHDYIFKDIELLKKHQKGEFNEFKDNSKNHLYLGRFVRFNEGISDTIMAKYDSLGASENLDKRVLAEKNIEFFYKAVELCKEHNVPIVLISYPVYYKHISNYEEYHKRLDSMAAKAGIPHYDMQMPYDTTIYTRTCFENSYDPNQHLTYYGSVVTAYKIARYIHDSLKIDLPVRDTSPRFHSWFYGDDQYFYNYPPKDGDTSAIAIKVSSSDKTKLLLSSYYEPKEKQNTTYFKVARAVGDSQPSEKLTMYLDGRYKGTRTIAKVDASLFHDVRPVRHELYGVNLIKEFEIDSIVGCEAKR